jgi:hypothetical protein
MEGLHHCGEGSPPPNPRPDISGLIPPPACGFLVPAADVAAERVHKSETEYPISDLLEPRQIRLGRVELENDRITLAWLQAFRPARLGDSQCLSSRRIRCLAVGRRISATQLDQLGNKRLIPAGIELSDLLDHERLPFDPVIRHEA